MFQDFLSFLVDKVTTVRYNFVSVILNVAFVRLSIAATSGFASGSASLVPLLVNTQFSDHVKIRFISQLINGLSSVLQKLLKCCYDATMSTSFSILLPSNFPLILVL